MIRRRVGSGTGGRRRIGGENFTQCRTELGITHCGGSSKPRCELRGRIRSQIRSGPCGGIAVYGHGDGLLHGGGLLIDRYGGEVELGLGLEHGL